MPHITRGVGPTNEADYPVAVTIHTSRAHLITDTTEPEPAGEEEPWAPGGSSTTSTSQPDNSNSSGEPTPSRPAPTTENPSPRDLMGSGSAGSTGGGNPTDEKPTED